MNKVLKNSTKLASGETFTMDLNDVVKDLYKIFPKERVVTDPTFDYGHCTTGSSREILIAVKAISVDEIRELVHLANRFQVGIYPVSTGRNWGYGTSLPVQDRNIILDLSLMNRILEFNADLGWVRLEPGVTQGQLRKFLDEHGYNFLVPTTGAGPHCSIMGNLLERGYGITPYQDHFEALLALEAVLPNGEIYHSPLKDIAGAKLHHSFKWGIGPYLDALFAQSNYGIVTEVTVAMATKPERLEVFSIEFDDASLFEAVTFIRSIKTELGTLLSGINLINKHRMMSMKSEYPSNPAALEKGLIKKEVLDQICRQHSISQWTIVGSIGGSPELVKAAKKNIKKKTSWAYKIRFLSTAMLPNLMRFAKWIPSKIGGTKLRMTLDSLRKLSDILEGRPSDVAFPLAYWKNSKKYDPQALSDLAKDTCGLIWYSPLVLMVPESVTSYIKFVMETCKKFQMEPLITLTTISERCFDSTVPILFSKENPEEVMRARECYKTLLEEGRVLGFFPYRLGVDSMHYLSDHIDEEHFTEREGSRSLNLKIKIALDPNNILAPGRYGV